jgi:hypothetical protein
MAYAADRRIGAPPNKCIQFAATSVLRNAGDRAPRLLLRRLCDPQAVIASNRRTVSAFVDAALAVSPAQWTTRRAPGKWSPGQVTEHVAFAYEQSGPMPPGNLYRTG